MTKNFNDKDFEQTLAEQPAPVQQGPCCHAGIAHDCHAGPGCRIAERLKASPPAQRTWVGLTDDEIAEQDWHLSADSTYEQWTLQEQLVVCGVKDFARAIEAKLKEKNT